jgi:REP element-mobilizing transposase RayT
MITKDNLPIPPSKGKPAGAALETPARTIVGAIVGATHSRDICDINLSNRDYASLLQAHLQAHLQNPPGNPHGKDLRIGRRSIAGQTYLITTVTQYRKPVFADFYAARQLVQTLIFEHQRGTADTLAYVVMPDHLHWLMTLGSIKRLAAVVQAVKAASARRLGRPVWQAGYHDHALRGEDDLVALARYIVANPLRAGLAEKIGDYPHWDAIWF